MRADLVERGSTESLRSPVDRVDEVLLANLIQGLQEFLLREDLSPTPVDHARLVVLLYRILARRRAELLRQGAPLPDTLGQPGHPFDFTSDPDLADIVHLAG
ncbi:hypothetical protein [Azospirillum halopraeferens]|uniref:hypothetical protein n=1 Tax=Azospirillum halopraeferens TaxID=34010 RepID=UPI001B3B7CA2|nr:hypothetical protein [Azospirillum halopraeferens]